MNPEQHFQIAGPRATLTGAIYTLRNAVYMADFGDFQNDNKVKIFTLDGESFKWKQTLELARRPDYLSETFRMAAVSYYD